MGHDQVCARLTTSVAPVLSGSVQLSPPPDCASNTLYSLGSSVMLTAVPATARLFSHWSGALVGSANPVTLTVNADQAVTANFILCYRLTVLASPAYGGSVGVSPASNCGDYYIAGTEVQFSAAPAYNYVFTGWSDGLTGTANPTTVVMNQNTIVRGNLAVTPACYHVNPTIYPSYGGRVTRTPANCDGSYTPGTVVQLTATPAYGYAFDSWSEYFNGTVDHVPVPHLPAAGPPSLDFPPSRHPLNLTKGVDRNIFWVDTAGWTAIARQACYDQSR
ncbi:MAG: hypothetical protein JXA93_13820 [Anaerolineae bacterium]|nr:hypothetical protein [Anaerolineae bacterium]